jgi:hypothetical protein
MDLVGIDNQKQSPMLNQAPIATTLNGIAGVADKMNTDKFTMLVDVLRILEKSSSPTIAQTALELIDNYDEALTQEQKAIVLREFLRLQHRGDDESKERHFSEAIREDQAKSLLRFDYL